MNIQTLPLFASYIILLDLDYNPKELSNKEIAFASRNTTHPLGKGDSLISKDIRILEKFPKTKKVLLNSFKEVAENFDYDNDFQISTSWMTASNKGQGCGKHYHAHSFYSGIYYFGTYNDNCGKIVFETPIGQFSSFEVVPKNDTIKNGSSWSMTPRHNLLIFFPSYLNHWIECHDDDTTRYSLAFNIVPTGEYGYDDSSYNTSWFK